MRRPVVAVNCDLEAEPRRQYPFVYLPYLDAVERAGGVPLLVPPYASAGLAVEAALRADAFLFTGSDDLDPAYYGQAPEGALGPVVPRRKTDTDLALLRAARSRGRPVLAVCGGMQLVNVALGGTLLQDIPSRLPSALRHTASGGAFARHAVEVRAGTLLAEWIGIAGTVEVNSAHHQAVDRIGKGLVASAVSPDGIVEAVETREKGLLLAVEWHPERDAPADARQQGLFDRLVEAAAATARA